MSRRFSLKLIIAGYNCFGLSREDWSEIFFHVVYIPAVLFFITTISNNKYLNFRSLICWHSLTMIKKIIERHIIYHAVQYQWKKGSNIFSKRKKTTKKIYLQTVLVNSHEHWPHTLPLERRKRPVICQIFIIGGSIWFCLDISFHTSIIILSS